MYSLVLQVIDKLSALYEHPSDIDLVVGVMAEYPLEGSLLGPTATCLFSKFINHSCFIRTISTL